MTTAGSAQLRAVGDRISVLGERGTIRYVGPLDTGAGDDAAGAGRGAGGVVWYGIEWVNCERGKHSGEYKARRLFTCRPGHGSFLRADRAKFDPNVSFLQAVREKYLPDAGDGTAADEAAVNDAAQDSTIEVAGISRRIETVGFARMGRLYSDLASATTIAVGERCIDRIDDVDAIRAALPNVQELDLSFNLLSSFAQLDALLEALPKLTSLKLCSNRFTRTALPADPSKSSLRELDLSATMLPWTELAEVVRHLPKLRVLDASGCDLPTPAAALQLDAFHNLTEVSLRHNAIDDLAAVLAAFPHAIVLNLAHNTIAQLHLQVSGPSSHPVEQLELSHNPLPTSFDALAPLARLGKLRVLALPTLPDRSIRSGRPSTIAAGETGAGDEGDRITALAAVPAITLLNRSRVTPQEKDDAALYRARRAGALNGTASAEGTARTSSGGAQIQGGGSSIGTGSAALSHKLITLRFTLAPVSAADDATLGGDAIGSAAPAGVGMQSTAKSAITEKRLPRDATVRTLRQTAARCVGVRVGSVAALHHIDTEPSSELEHGADAIAASSRSRNGRKTELSDDLATLSYYGIESGTVLVHLRT